MNAARLSCLAAALAACGASSAVDDGPRKGTPPAWSEARGSTAPPPRFYHTAVYDDANQQMVVYGGTDGSRYYSDVWLLPLSSSTATAPLWTELAVAGSPQRSYHSAAYDSANHRMLVFGGFNEALTQFDSDVWALSLTDSPRWEKLAVSGAPPGRRQNTGLVYDAANRRAVLFGGYDPFTTTPLGDVWTLSLDATPTWTQIPTTGGPHGRELFAKAYDPARQRLLVFGGIDTYDLKRFDDVWALSLNATPAWTQLAPTGAGPTIRDGVAGLVDPTSGSLVIFGGYHADDGGFNGTHGLDDTWSLSLPNAWTASLVGPSSWTPITPTPAPPQRFSHTAVLDAPHHQMVIFGGADGSGMTLQTKNDTWLLALP